MAETLKSPAEERKERPSNPQHRDAREGPKSPNKEEKGTYLADLEDDLEVLEIEDKLEGMKPRNKSMSPMKDKTNGKSRGTLIKTSPGRRRTRRKPFRLSPIPASALI